MGINEIILWLMLILMAVAGLDRCLFGYRLGLGDKFEEGFNSLGALALSMVGAICIAPVLGAVLEPIVGPIYQALGANPAMFATTLLANDMGGQPLAMDLSGANAIIAADPGLSQLAKAGDAVGLEQAFLGRSVADQNAYNAGNFAGLILGAMMGPTIVFSIPVALGIIDLEDRPFLAKGILIGMITIPLGCLAGGLIKGYPLMWMVMNLIPVFLVAIAIAVGLAFIPNAMIKGFLWFGKFVILLLTAALIAAGIEGATGRVIIPGMAPISEGFAVIGGIAVVLAGAFTLVHLMTKYLGQPLSKIGGLLGMNSVAAAGLVATLANNIAMFSILKDMDDRGKVINVAFCVSAAFTFGDHLGFTAGVNATMIFAMIVGKLVGGVTAVILAYFMAPKADRAQQAERAAKAAA
ncbi:ethanolamine utilization protein EutH [Deltaproteobacteria bacterium OttesenSCG-928-M10]|nr:ethanolamine utilization protein EutH [Deltaproteobacteria bacterium OttesenSCG-928-M10]